MNGKFTKSQIRIMALLGLMIVLLAGGVFMLNFRVADAPTDTPPTVVPHEKLRTARPSLSPYFNREINLGGSGDDTLSEIFTDGNRLFLLGTTSSSDCDFDGEGGAFLAIMNADLSTNAFFQYGKSGDTLAKSALCEDGFVLGINTESGSEVLVVGFDGAVKHETDTSGVGQEKIVDIKVFSEETVVITVVKNSAVESDNLKARVYGEDMVLKAERIFTHACSQEYLDTFFVNGNFVTVVNLRSAIINRMAFISWGLQKQGLFYDIDIGASGGYHCEAVVPYVGGFFAVIVDSEKLCDIITITENFTLHSRVFLKQSAVESANAFYTPDGFCLFISHGEGLSNMLLLDNNLQQKSALAQFSSVNEVSFHALFNDTALFCACDLSGLRLIGISGGDVNTDMSFGSPTTSDARAVRVGGKLIVACDFSSVNGDATENFGGRDIWLAAVND